MNGNLDLNPAVDALADAAAAHLLVNFDEFALDDLGRILRDEWRMRGLPFNDNAGRKNHPRNQSRCVGRMVSTLIWPSRTPRFTSVRP